MKRSYILTLLTTVFIAGLFSQCEKKLNLAPLGALNEETYYQSTDDFKGAAVLAYSTLLNYTYEQFDAGGWFKGTGMIDDDQTSHNNGADNIEEFNWRSTDGTWSALWSNTYKGIQRTNIIIEKLPAAKGVSDSTKKVFEAEARFLRGYFNFFLAINWGNAPLITVTPRTLAETRVGNSQPGELWDAAIADLKLAKAGLPVKWDDANKGRATSGAASAMLGKLLLFRAQWEKKPALYTEAAAEFQGLVGKYSLVKNYLDNFMPTTENNAESVFEVQMGIGGVNPWLPADFVFSNGSAAGTARLIYYRAACGPNNVCAPGAGGTGYGQIEITTGLQKEFEAGDPRRQATLFLDGDPYDTGTNIDGSQKWVYSKNWTITGSTPAKYVRKDVNIDYRSPLSVNNQRTIRYADILLMLAECKLLGSKDLAGAVALINQVRQRADATGKILPDVAVGTDAQIFKALMHERRVEFALEDHRYDDLVRWHRAGLINIKTDVDFGRTTANTNWAEKNLLKPVPQSERDLNPAILQNTGF
ncbi:RagB/SusD family nutrient uptake outer membrane protein [Spirosoma aureum]|uniref:RagB/SusD family nutrient uptake outer membrane protein n=1 Tax=Spirosoma aureum TaxID=2692134 RepID=A0A6G9AY86_9BACT|nr:RagB/SusD family nutrient uptake outer membrane protein [Spirosoma aureum]QIP17326.1 RagB/SusD family nutrient uptake outer membrane protein [Spirosoma aureum]